MDNNIDAGMYKKMSPEDVQGLLWFRKRAYVQKNKKKKELEMMKEEDRKEVEMYERD